MSPLCRRCGIVSFCRVLQGAESQCTAVCVNSFRFLLLAANLLFAWVRGRDDSENSLLCCLDTLLLSMLSWYSIPCYAVLIHYSFLCCPDKWLSPSEERLCSPVKRIIRRRDGVTRNFRLNGLRPINRLRIGCNLQTLCCRPTNLQQSVLSRAVIAQSV
jgi:hypothetical protein